LPILITPEGLPVKPSLKTTQKQAFFRVQALHPKKTLQISAEAPIGGWLMVLY